MFVERAAFWVQAKMAEEGDIFDSVLFLEESCYREGYEEGWKAGQSEGRTEGYNLGLQKGGEISSEVGFYSGFVQMWIVLNKNTTDDRKRKRICKSLEGLKHLIGSLDVSNPTNQKLFTDLAKVRAKFKQVCFAVVIYTLAL
ncbi:protein LTO1 homolog isoform X2 [Nematostella vectensis]|uniref:protein LTO1 homolog isoform X2 n=1 Tax=Nematostella vectensis TaxID=45351 RepID=UPI002077791F|nr:protein LTO1 homolog isoform X2 [Nematostella vectensis]